jgi:hypothetical protein
MARILVLEPHPDVRDLVEHVGHEPLLSAEDGRVDAIVVEPESPSLLAVAQEVVAREADAAVVGVSIAPASPASRSLAPIEHVIKPFGLEELKTVLAEAVGGELRQT